MNIHYLNGAFVTESDLLISPRDLGYSRGFAVFDFLKTYNRRPFLLKEHILRLQHSAHAIQLSCPWSTEELSQLVLKTLEKNDDGKEKFIKITISGGVGYGMRSESTPTLIIMVDEATQYPLTRYSDGIGIVTQKHTRYRADAKTNNYIEGIQGYLRAKEIGAEEPVYYDDHQVFEGSNSNIFIVRNGKICTPKDGILPGITRAVLLTLPHHIEEANFSIQELHEAEEVFLTGSGKEISPVTHIDGNPVGGGKVGPVTKDIIQSFKNYTDTFANS